MNFPFKRLGLRLPALRGAPARFVDPYSLLRFDSCHVLCRTTSTLSAPFHRTQPTLIKYDQSLRGILGRYTPPCAPRYTLSRSMSDPSAPFIRTAADPGEDSAQGDELWCPCITCSTKAYRRKTTRKTLHEHTGLRPKELNILVIDDQIGLYRAYLAAVTNESVSYEKFLNYLTENPQLAPLEGTLSENIDVSLKRGRAHSSATQAASSSSAARRDQTPKRRRVDDDASLQEVRALIHISKNLFELFCPSRQPPSPHPEQAPFDPLPELDVHMQSPPRTSPRAPIRPASPPPIAIDDPLLLQSPQQHPLPEPVPEDPGSQNTVIPDEDALPDEQPPGEDPENDESSGTVEDLPGQADFKRAEAFISSIKNATLDNCGLSPDAVRRLRSPPVQQYELDTGEYADRLSFDLFLASRNASQNVYNGVRDVYHHHNPDTRLLSLAQIKYRLPLLTGIESIVTDMCPNSCHAYTGPFETLDKCVHCGEPRYDAARSTPNNRVPRQQFHTIPIAPILQVLRLTPESAKRFDYLRVRVERLNTELQQNPAYKPPIWDDFDTGTDFIKAVKERRVSPFDSVLMFSIDGAQLYRNKQSDAWIAIFMLMNFAPEVRYLKDCIFPAFTIPGPNKPKDYDSYLAPTLQHLSAAQKEGIIIPSPYDRNQFVKDHPFLAYIGADRLALGPISGTAGHQAKYGCRSFCPAPGRHKANQSTYYPVFKKPNNYNVAGSTHGNLNYMGKRDSPDNIQER